MRTLNNAENLNIDDFVNYASEYKLSIRGSKLSGEQINGRCPFHEDTSDSFSANTKTGMWKCFAGCGEGNYVSFYAKLHGINTSDAYKDILKVNGKLEDTFDKKDKQQMLPLTVKEYALLKKIPEDYLTNFFFLKNSSHYNTKCVSMPYLGADMKPVAERKRFSANEQGKNKFRWKAGSKASNYLYGLWQIKNIRSAGKVILVEGESDTQTLWYLKFPALGVPGADVAKASMLTPLEGVDNVYIHTEPDAGGQTFLEKMCRLLKENNFSGSVYEIKCSQVGYKDPSELFVSLGKEESTEKLIALLSSARPIDVDNKADTLPEVIEDAPISLRQPAGWLFSDSGISHIDEKTLTPTLICKTPILISRRLKSIETGDEKIEISFKRDDEWHNSVFNRSTIFTSRNVTVLADLGCTVTSENAKPVVKFLGDLEAENIDVIPKDQSTSTFGWLPGGRFLPGFAEDVVLDIDNSLRSWANAYHTHGSFGEWKKIIEGHRVRNKFRFIIAAAFAAPLLRIVNQRIFFVYNWGNSKGGKSAGLKAALSVWGDPEKLMVNFNATQVALERMAGFYNDLPLGIDERQLAGNKQDALEKIVYMLASGTGRARGSKGGGLQALNTWRTVAISTGEEPITTDTSQTGVSTRILEIYGGPFTGEKEAALMHQQASQNYGHAGREFMKCLLNTDEREIVKAYDAVSKTIAELSDGISGSHISGISVVTLADMLVESWLFETQKTERNETDNGKLDFKVTREIWTRSIEMAIEIIAEQKRSGIVDVNENALQFVNDWVLSNQSMFDGGNFGTKYGFTKGNRVYVFPSILNKALKDAGYSPRKTIQFLKEQGKIGVDTEGKWSINKYFNGKRSRFIELIFEEDIEADFAGEPVELTEEEQLKLPFD